MLCNGLDCNRPETFCIYLSFLLAVLFWISKGCRSLFFIFIFIFYFTVFLLWEVELYIAFGYIATFCCVPDVYFVSYLTLTI